jgi:hypothetical protein
MGGLVLATEQTYQDMFNDYLMHYQDHILSNKSNLEITRLYSNFRKNIEKVIKHNSRDDKSYTLGINAFAALSYEEISGDLIRNTNAICTA